MASFDIPDEAGAQRRSFVPLPALEYLRLTPLQRAHYDEQICAHVSNIIYDGDLEQAAALQKAGWIPERPNLCAPIMSWFWRRPGPLGGKLYKSTNQAYQALTRK